MDHLQDLMRRYFDAWASPYTSSGSTSVSCVIKEGAGILGGVIIATDGVSDVTVSLYDNASEASGKKIIPTLVVPATDRYGGYILGMPGVAFTNGCYLDITGGNGEAVVFYS